MFRLERNSTKDNKLVFIVSWVVSLIVVVLRLSPVQNIGIPNCNNLVMKLYNMMSSATEAENEFVAMDED